VELEDVWALLFSWLYPDVSAPLPTSNGISLFLLTVKDTKRFHLVTICKKDTVQQVICQLHPISLLLPAGLACNRWPKKSFCILETATGYELEVTSPPNTILTFPFIAGGLVTRQDGCFLEVVSTFYCRSFSSLRFVSGSMETTGNSLTMSHSTFSILFYWWLIVVHFSSIRNLSAADCLLLTIDG
jgi:hypothetical protein